MTAEEARGARNSAGVQGPLTLIHRNKVPNPMPARVSGLSYTLKKAWHVAVFEDGLELGGGVFDEGIEGRSEADEFGRRWLAQRRDADVRAT